MAHSFNLDGWQIVFFSDFDASDMPWVTADIRIPDDLQGSGVDSIILTARHDGITVAVGFDPAGWRLPEPERPEAWSSFFTVEGDPAVRLATCAMRDLVREGFLPPARYRQVLVLAHRDGITWTSAPTRAFG